MESHDLELGAPQGQRRFVEERQPESCWGGTHAVERASSDLPHGDGVCGSEAQGQIAAEPETVPEAADIEGQSADASEEHEASWQKSRDTNACAAAPSESSAEDDETQLAAIRELMQHATARGIWLTLGEIAEVTEFAEASISAQLRHLRKLRHGGHRVEKRRRSPAGTAEVARAGDLRRGPVIWEYRVLPKGWRGPGRAKSAAALAAGAGGAATYDKTDSSGNFFERREQELSPGSPRNDGISGGSTGGNAFDAPQSSAATGAGPAPCVRARNDSR